MCADERKAQKSLRRPSQLLQQLSHETTTATIATATTPAWLPHIHGLRGFRGKRTCTLGTGLEIQNLSASTMAKLQKKMRHGNLSYADVAPRYVPHHARSPSDSDAPDSKRTAPISCSAPDGTGARRSVSHCCADCFTVPAVKLASGRGRNHSEFQCQNCGSETLAAASVSPVQKAKSRAIAASSRNLGGSRPPTPNPPKFPQYLKQFFKILFGRVRHGPKVRGDGTRRPWWAAPWGRGPTCERFLKNIFKYRKRGSGAAKNYKNYPKNHVKKIHPVYRGTKFT
eukprot:SAG11_NODE_471_length_9197_cov_292.216751_2_plen_284_part_00